MPAYVSTYGVTNLYYNGKMMASNWNSPEWLKIHQELGDLYNKDKIFGFGRQETFNANDALFYTGTTVHARNKNSYFGEFKANKTLYFVPMPKRTGEKYYQGYGEIEAYGIPKGASNPEAVPYFLRYFLDLDKYNEAGIQIFGNKEMQKFYTETFSKAYSTKKVFYKNLQGPLTLVNSDWLHSKVWQEARNVAPGQVAVSMAKNANIVDNAVKEANKKLASIK